MKLLRGVGLLGNSGVVNKKIWFNDNWFGGCDGSDNRNVGMVVVIWGEGGRV